MSSWRQNTSTTRSWKWEFLNRLTASGATRAIDILDSLPFVDTNRIGACGGSGGGMQTEMLLALDDRIKAAVIVGMTSDYREVLFPHVASAVCVHFPGALRIANQPEISALGLPTPVLYITMNDFTKNFIQDDFPRIQELYLANGCGARVQ